MIINVYNTLQDALLHLFIKARLSKWPYYIGTKLWDNLPKETKECKNIFVFKKLISHLYKVYKKPMIANMFSIILFRKTGGLPQ